MNKEIILTILALALCITAFSLALRISKDAYNNQPACCKRVIK